MFSLATNSAARIYRRPIISATRVVHIYTKGQAADADMLNEANSKKTMESLSCNTSVQHKSWRNGLYMGGDLSVGIWDQGVWKIKKDIMLGARPSMAAFVRNAAIRRRRGNKGGNNGLARSCNESTQYKYTSEVKQIQQTTPRTLVKPTTER